MNMWQYRDISQAFNRTILELKLNAYIMGENSYLAFNRTILELKLGVRRKFTIDNVSFNRTILELKH